MQLFQIHTLESAPEKSRPALEGLKKAFGFIPNAAATMGGNPVLINAFVNSFGSFHGGTLDEREKQIVLLTNAVAFRCGWTTAFHSTLALKSGIADQDVLAIRSGKLPSDAKFAALSGLAKALIERKGHSVQTEIDHFTLAGYQQSQVLEVIAAVAISTMAALTTNVADTPVEELFKSQLWKAA